MEQTDVLLGLNNRLLDAQSCLDKVQTGGGSEVRNMLSHDYLQNAKTYLREALEFASKIQPKE